MYISFAKLGVVFRNYLLLPLDKSRSFKNVLCFTFLTSTLLKTLLLEVFLFDVKAIIIYKVRVLNKDICFLRY